jgi:CRP-like cAMP-binding protein
LKYSEFKYYYALEYMSLTAVRERSGVIAPGIRKEVVNPGESLPIYQSGGGFLYYLEAGVAVLERDNFRGDWDSLGYFRAESIFGERLKGAEHPHHKRVTALTISSILRIERERLEEILAQSGALAAGLTVAQERDAYAFEERVALLEGTTLAERIPGVLLDITGSRADVRISASQETFAKAVGGERATVNQMLMRLRRRRILYDKGLMIKGEEGLSALKSMAEGVSPVVANKRPANGTVRPVIPS